MTSSLFVKLGGGEGTSTQGFWCVIELSNGKILFFGKN